CAGLTVTMSRHASPTYDFVATKVTPSAKPTMAGESIQDEPWRGPLGGWNDSGCIQTYQVNASITELPKETVSEPIRVREWFPETLFWRPELITDDNGRASLNVDLADSVTTWRLTTSAVSADGRLGANQSSLRVFQPFFVDLNLPVALTRGDEVAVAVVVYHYLAQPQNVQLTRADRQW